LFDGQGLQEWTQLGPSSGARPETWSFSGVLVGRRIGRGLAGGNQLVNRREFRNFHLRMEFQLDTDGKFFLYFRAPPNSWRPPTVQLIEPSALNVFVQLGRPAQISAVVTRSLNAGPNFTPQVNSKLAAGPADKWYRLELTANEKEIITTIDGEVTSRGTASFVQSGTFVLSVANSTVHIRKIDVKSLP